MQLFAFKRRIGSNWRVESERREAWEELLTPPPRTSRGDARCWREMKFLEKGREGISAA